MHKPTHMLTRLHVHMYKTACALTLCCRSLHVLTSLHTLILVLKYLQLCMYKPEHMLTCLHMHKPAHAFTLCVHEPACVLTILHLYLCVHEPACAYMCDYTPAAVHAQACTCTYTHANTPTCALTLCMHEPACMHACTRLHTHTSRLQHHHPCLAPGAETSSGTLTCSGTQRHLPTLHTHNPSTCKANSGHKK